MKEFLFLLLPCCFLFAGCGKSAKEQTDARASIPIEFSPRDASNAWSAAGALVAGFTPRDAGTEGCELAAKWLHKELEKRDVSSRIDTFRDKTPRGEKYFHNVLGTLGGTGDEWIILLSHFDTMSGIGKGFEGANDSASSTGLLLELARVLRSTGPHKTNFLFGFMDGEECMLTYCGYDGFHGSKRLARQMKQEKRNVRAVILADMVGDRDLKITVPRNGAAELRVLALEAAEKAGVRDQIGLFDGAVFDDHQAFLDQGFPAVDLIDFEFGSAPGKNDYWHTPQDTMDKISAESLHVTGRIICEMIERLQGPAGK